MRGEFPSHYYISHVLLTAIRNNYLPVLLYLLSEFLHFYDHFPLHYLSLLGHLQRIIVLSGAPEHIPFFNFYFFTYRLNVEWCFSIRKWFIHIYIIQGNFYGLSILVSRNSFSMVLRPELSTFTTSLAQSAISVRNLSGLKFMVQTLYWCFTKYNLLSPVPLNLHKCFQEFLISYILNKWSRSAVTFRDLLSLISYFFLRSFDRVMMKRSNSWVLGVFSLGSYHVLLQKCLTKIF